MTDTGITINQRMQNALQYIQNSLDEALDPEKIAARAHFSLSHFHRIFKGMIGETLGEHVRRLRLERAAHNIIYSDQPITTIAFDAGYETLESFSRAFKKTFGEAPSQYRETKREIKFPETPSGIHYTPGVKPEIKSETLEEIGLDVRIEIIDPVRVAFVRHIGPYMECTKAWDILCGWASAKGILDEKTPCIGVCYDDPTITPSGKIRYDACIKVAEHVEPEGEVAIKVLPGGKYAVTTHRGPYADLEWTYIRFMGQWLPASGNEMINQPTFELYINNPGTTAPKDLITELYISLV